MKTYWTPTTKAELIAWFKRNRPEWKNMSKMKKKQLFAVFYKTLEE